MHDGNENEPDQARNQKPDSEIHDGFDHEKNASDGPLHLSGHNAMADPDLPP